MHAATAVQQAQGSPGRVSLWEALRAVKAKYGDMPDLSLTQAQAQRLLGLDRAVSKLILGWLVDDGFLQHSRGHFVKR